MDYEDDLSAPVWDDLNPLAEADTVEETALSEEEIEEQNEDSDGEEEVQVDPTSGGWGDNNETKKELLNDLAPMEDPLSGLLNESPSKRGTTPGALFESQTAPLISINEDDLSASSYTAAKGHGTPRKLFDSSRIRRNIKVPLNSDGNSAKSESSHSVIDPLGQAEKDREFVDEPLDDRVTNSQHANRSIFEQVESPLYHISPKKKAMDTNTDITPTESVHNKTEEANQKDIEDEPVIIHFQIEVTDPIKVGELTSSHIKYTVNAESELLSPNQNQVSRRYRDFRWLYRQLQNNHWGKVIPPPPEKQTVGTFQPEFVETRRLQLQTMLRRIANDSDLQRDEHFHMFLTSDNFAEDSKRVSYETGSNANNDNNDISEVHISEIQLLGPEEGAFVIKNGGLDSEYKKGFMNISFSSIPKYNEPDKFFVDELDRITDLENQLKKMLKAVESIEEQRRELSSYTYDLASLIESLGALDVTKGSTKLCYELAETQKRVKDSLERDALQEAITMGATLDEYVRSLASLRSIFYQRAKLGYYLVIVENDFQKKKQDVEKMCHNNKQPANKERFLAARDSVKNIERRAITVKKAWHDIGGKIKKEVSSFDRSKMEEFRNCMEITLESAIESQKESIELWETMYHENL